MTGLALHGLTFAVGGRVLLDSVTARIEAGRCAVVLGPNGAGKSLLMRLCHGLILPTGGHVEAPPRSSQAMVFQRPVMLRRSVLANVRYALTLAGVAGRARDEQAQAALDRFGLGPLSSRPARVLSGGEQQRLALARAWSVKPTILFLDEPTASLDPAATDAVERAILAFHAAGTTVVLTTHDLGQARRLAQDVLMLAGGRLIEHGPAQTVFAAPRSDVTRKFLTGELIW